MPDNTLSTLEQIRIKIRRLTRTPSSAQLSDDDIDNYVNNFVLYDFPAHLIAPSLTEVLTFYTDPYIDTYSTNTADPNNPLYNFKNEYVGVKGPAYISGCQAYLSFSLEQFYNAYPRVQFRELIGTGDGVTTNFSGTLSDFPVLRENVLISAIDNNDSGLEGHDDGEGNFEGDVVAGGTIDYVTGDYDITFTLAVKSGEDVYANTMPYVPTLPTNILYFKDEFTLRPIPDRPYRVDVTCYRRPTEFLNADDMPELSQWWQYIAYGAAKKVFEDRMDIDSIQKIMPEFKNQELLINRKRIKENSQKRAATIYASAMPISADTGFNDNI